MLGGPAGLRAAGAPWWICCVFAALGAGTVCLHIVFPQDSPDKLAWWRERRRSRPRCRCREGDNGLYGVLDREFSAERG